MANYHTFKLPCMTIILSSGELVSLLQKDPILFKKSLQRGKYALRAESKKEQYAKKLGEHESKKLNEFI